MLGQQEEVYKLGDVAQYNLVGPWADPLTLSHLSSGRLWGTPGL